MKGKSYLFISHDSLPQEKAAKLMIEAQTHIEELEAVHQDLLAALENPSISNEEEKDIHKLIKRTKRNLATLHAQLEDLKKVT